MFSFESVDPQSLPSVDWRKKKDLPQKPGIYFFIDESNAVRYIGMSRNIQRRVSGHNHRKFLQSQPKARVAYLTVSDLAISDPFLIPEIENALIKHFQPDLNITREGTSNRQIGDRPKLTKTYRINADLVEALEARAKDQGVTQVQLLEEAIAQFLQH